MSWSGHLLKSKLLWIAIVAAGVAAVVLLSGKNPVAVKAVAVQPGELRVIVNATTTSTVKSETEATLSAQRTGRVVRLPVREGDFVKADELIAQVDLAEESFQAENATAQSRATFEEAGKNLTRMEDLWNKGLIAQRELDAARRAHDVAQSQYRAALGDAGVKRDYSVIRAPFAGVIAKKYTEVGELLIPGKQIVTLVNPDKIYVLAMIDEVDVGRLRLGQTAAVTVDAFPGEKFPGTITRISPIVSGGKLETRTVDVWISFTERNPKIKPGMSADVEILLTTLPGVLAVPSQAIIEREGKKQVFVLNTVHPRPGDRAAAQLRPVEIGETNWSYTQVTHGLAAGDHVITTPEAEGLKDGVRVSWEE